MIFIHYVETAWPMIEKPSIRHHEEAYFLVRFDIKLDYEEALISVKLKGRNQIIIRKWHENSTSKMSLLGASLAIWVRLSNLSFYCWSQDSLN